jgi:hypothetical protein
VRNRWQSVAADVWDRIADRENGRVDLTICRQEVFEVLRTEQVADDIVEEMAEALVRKEERRRSPRDKQPSLLSEEWLDVYWATDDNVRVQAGVTVLADYQKHMARVNENREAVNKAADQENRVFLELLPYLASDPALTARDAQKLWAEEHPEDGPDSEEDEQDEDP